MADEEVRSNIEMSLHNREESSRASSLRNEIRPDQSDDTILLRQDVYKPPQEVYKPPQEECTPPQEANEPPQANPFSDEKEVVIPDEKEVLVHSPPLTGKDSAYSSVAGTSYASPTSTHPRSASAQSSQHPRAQFGLFPSSSPSTPKHSISGRHGALSPALTARMTPEPSTQLPPRAQTSLDNHEPSSRGRLLKKSSLSSLRRLFSKKKHNGVETIVE